MAKPAAPFSWATDPTFSTGPKSLAPTRVEPSPAQKAQGDVPGDGYAAEWHNWALYQLGKWTEYTDALPTESAFRGANFAWTGAHTFAAPVLCGGGLNASYYAFPSPVLYDQFPLRLGLAQPVSSNWVFHSLGFWLSVSAVAGDEVLMIPIVASSNVTISDYRVHLTDGGGGCTATVELISLSRSYATGATTSTVHATSGVITLASAASTYTTPSLAPVVTDFGSSEYFFRITRHSGQPHVRAAFLSFGVTQLQGI
jgi:hypothetical protein